MSRLVAHGSIAKLETKVGKYAEQGWVSLTKSSFGRLCGLVRAAFSGGEDASIAEEDGRQAAAKLFYIIGRQQKTSAATALFSKQSHLQSLPNVPWEDIDWYAAHPRRSSISGMFSYRGFPDRAGVEALERWVDENVAASKKSRVFSSITGMQAGRGAPATEELDTLKAWCVAAAGEAGDWTGLLSSVMGMQHGRGVPATQPLDGLKRWCEQQSIHGQTWLVFLKLIALKREGIPAECLSK